jgi:uncharacterized protein (TIGR00255 family)
MIHSMTAFSRVQSQGKWGSLTCEMRSINHRYLEISLHLPEILRVLEMPIRDLIRQHVKRGKIECNVRFQAGQETNAAVVVNKKLAKELCQAAEEISSFLGQASGVQPADILRFPGVLETQEADTKTLHEEGLKLVQNGLKELVTVRLREGDDLRQLFLGRMKSMDDQIVKVRERIPEVAQEAKDKLTRRFNEAKLELDPMRLEQEMVMFAQKVDIAEEIERTETHINELRRVLKEGGAVGRRLDFLLQELNREANTLGSKSADPTLTHAAVEMKVLIEQIREQVQNVE